MDNYNKPTTHAYVFAITLLALSTLAVTSSFTVQNNICNPQFTVTRSKTTQRIPSPKRPFITQLHVKSVTTSSDSTTSGKGFGRPINPKIKRNIEDEETANEEQIMKMNPTQLKEKLFDLVPRMTGTREEFKLVELYVNALEDKYIPPQTLDFLNMAMVGEWQFLFTTNQLGKPKRNLRISELVQKLEVNGFDGKISNKASWDLAEDGTTFNARGTFESSLSYKINQGARMTIDNDLDLKVTLGKGSALPNDIQALIGFIHAAIPTELFDSSDLAMDTTYLDTDIRIVRFTGSRHEGVRDIFMRKGLIEINPSGMDS